MKKVRVKFSWSTKKPLGMASFARGTVDGMTGNAHFLTPDVAYTLISTSATRVELAYANRKNGQVGKDELTNSVAEQDTLLRTQMGYVMKVSGGDATIIHSGNWVTTGAPKAKATIADQQAAPALKAISGGNINVTSAKVPKASVYVFVLVLGTDFTVTILNGLLCIPLGVVAYTATSTKHTASFTCIPGLQEVTVAMYTVNAAGTSLLSSVGTCLNLGLMTR